MRACVWRGGACVSVCVAGSTAGQEGGRGRRWASFAVQPAGTGSLPLPPRRATHSPSRMPYLSSQPCSWEALQRRWRTPREYSGASVLCCSCTGGGREGERQHSGSLRSSGSALRSSGSAAVHRRSSGRCVGLPCLLLPPCLLFRPNLPAPAPVLPLSLPPAAHPPAVEGQPCAVAGGGAHQRRLVVVVRRLHQRQHQVLHSVAQRGTAWHSMAQQHGTMRAQGGIPQRSKAHASA